MLLVRTGGLFGVLVALIVAGIFMFVVRPAINDTTQRAFDTADRALDQAQRQTDEVRSTIAEATENGDYLSAAAFGAAVRDIKAELGGDAELLDFTVSDAGGGNVKYRTGDRAAGLSWGPGRDGLQPVDVTLVGSGKLDDNVFPIAKLAPGAATTLAEAVRAKAGDGVDVETMTLGLAPVSGAVQWTVTADDRGRALVFTAKANGSGLRAVD
jgi:type II secretory pathway pseudopilin PulG